MSEYSSVGDLLYSAVTLSEKETHRIQIMRPFPSCVFYHDFKERSSIFYILSLQILLIFLWIFLCDRMRFMHTEICSPSLSFLCSTKYA
jgi:hypothetical protein